MNIILYHADCMDGKGAALAAWLRLGDTDSHYQPIVYNTGLPTLHAGVDWADSTVYLLDFCLPPDQLGTLARHIGPRGQLIILDHHETNYTAVRNAFLWSRDPTQSISPVLADTAPDQARLAARFAAHHSGAILAWQHFHGSDNPPRLLQLIEDRDLWRFRFPDSRPLHYALAGCSDFRDLAEGLHDGAYLDSAIAEGRLIIEHLQQHWDCLIATASIGPNPLLADPKRHTTALLACPRPWVSDVGNHLLATLPTIQLALLYSDDHAANRRDWSLRSRHDGPHCGQLATVYGGGGHANSAGFDEPLGRWIVRTTVALTGALRPQTALEH